MKRQYLTINQAAQRLGVSAKTLRRWEEKGILVPKRSIGNQRRYLLSDIEKREKKAFTINEAAARLFVSANTLRRWEAKGIITPKRSLGNQRFYTLADIQKLEAMHYPTVDEKETAVEQMPEPIVTAPMTETPPVITPLPPVIASDTSLSLRDHEVAKQSQFDGRDRHVAEAPRDDKEENNVDKPRFFDLASVNNPKEKPTENPISPVIASDTSLSLRDHEVAKQSQNIPFTLSPAFHGIPKPIDTKREQAHNDEYNSSKQNPSIPWQIAKHSTHWTVALSSFVGVILILAAITKYGDPVTLLSHIPYLNTSQYINSQRSEVSSQKSAVTRDVLQSATQRRDYGLRINLPVEFMQTASVAGNLTAPNILYSILPGENITISGDPQNPTIAAVVEDLEAFGFVSGDGIGFDGDTITNDDPGSAQNIFKNIKVGSDTISAGSNTDTLELAAGSNISLSTDTSNKKITISASGGSSGGISGIAVLEGGTTVSDDIDTLDFLAGDFDVGESPTGEANVSLASTLTSVTGVAGNFSIGGTTTLNGIAYSWPGSQGADYILQTDGAGTLSWIDSSSLPDLGDVVGPNSSTDHALARFDLTTGKLIQNSGVIVDDSNNVTGVNALTIAPASDTTALTLTGTNTTSQNLAYFNANNASGTIFDISYGSTQTLTGALIGQTIDLNNGQITATNFDVTGSQITLPTVTNTNAAGTIDLLGQQVTFGSGAGINQNGAGATIYSALDVLLPALTQTQGSLTANGLAITTPSSITTGGVANGLLISPTGVGAGTLNGVNVATISAAGNGNETALNIGTNWDTVLRVNGTPVINGQGVTLATGGGTGQGTYVVGDILYADSTSTLTKLAIGGSDDYVLKVSSGVPTWGTITGSSCTTCVITNPSATATNTIAPTGQDTTGLIVRQTSTASPTNDIFRVTDSSGSTVYFRVDEDGNVYPSSSIGNTLTLTPATDTTALTLVGTNVTTAALQYINANNQQGTIFNLNYGASQTLSTSTPLIGIGVDLSTNVTATNATVTGTNLTLPGATNTHTSGLKELTGISVQSGGGINQNGAGGTTTFAAFDATIPALTQTDGTLNGYGLNVTTPSSITTGGTAAALNVAASGIGAGTLYGLNISGITAGAGAETALNIGTGWDSILSLNGTSLIDGSGNFNISGASGILPVENGGSPFEQAAGAIFPRLPTQDLLIGGVSTTSATFHAYGSVNAGTNPVASIAANTSFAGLITDNSGSGDLFTASSSGQTRFTIKQNGDLQIGNLTYRFPSSLSSGNILQTDGNGILSWIDPGSLPNSDKWDTENGVIYPKQAHNLDLLIGGTSSSSARFHVYSSTNGGITPSASVSANSTFAGLVVDNRGSGDLFTASSSGLNRFVIKQNGDVQIGAYTGSPNLLLTGSDTNSVGPSMTWAEDPTRYIRGRYDSSANRLIFENDTGNPILALGRGATTANSVGIGTTTFTATLDVRGNPVNGGTTPIASLSARTSYAGLVVDNSSRGDLFTASASGAMRFAIRNNGNVELNYGGTGRLCLGDVGHGQSWPGLANCAQNSTNGYALIQDSTGAYTFINKNSTSGYIGFRIANTDAMVVDQSSNVGIGDTSPDYRLDVENSTTSYVGNFQNNTSTGQGVRIQIRTEGTPGNFIQFQSLSGGADFTNGTITGNGGGGTNYNTTSDQRLKENIVATDYSINDLMKVNVRNFNFIAFPGQTTTGYIAQELYTVYPPAVHVGGSDPLTEPWGVDAGALTPLIIKGVQDQQGQITELKEQIDAMIAGSLDTQSLMVNNLSTQTLTLAGENVNTKLVGLDQSASTSASLGTEIASLNSHFSSLTSRVASLEASLQLLTTHNSQLTDFSASSSAELSLDSLEVNGQILTDSLSVLGYTTMNELSVTGSIRTGVLTIKGQSNGGASISTLNGDLRLQDQGFGGLDILDGLVTVDLNGNIETQGEITTAKLNIDETNTLSASVGQGTIPLNGTNALIYTTAVTSDSRIFITPRTKTNQQLSVTTQVSGGYFKVEITYPAPAPVKFDWWVIN